MILLLFSLPRAQRGWAANRALSERLRPPAGAAPAPPVVELGGGVATHRANYKVSRFAP